MERDGYLRRAADDVVVRDNVAVRGDDEAAAGGRGLRGLAEDVRARRGAVDAHDAVDGGGIDLRGAHGRLAVDLLDRDGRSGAAALRDGRAAVARVVCEHRAAVAARAAHNRSREDDGRDLRPAGGGLFLLMGLEILHRLLRGLLAGIAVAVMVEIVFVVEVAVVIVHGAIPPSMLSAGAGAEDFPAALVWRGKIMYTVGAGLSVPAFYHLSYPESLIVALNFQKEVKNFC